MRETAITSLNETRKYLIGISDELIQDFAEIIAGDWGLYQSADFQNTFLLDIEVFPDGYGLAAYPSDRNLTQLGYKNLLEKYPDGPLREANFNLDTSSYDFDNEKDLLEIGEYFTSLTDFYFNWVSKCWDDAGGKDFNKPIYLMMHDSNQSFDLLNKKWVDYSVKWPEV